MIFPVCFFFLFYLKIYFCFTLFLTCYLFDDKIFIIIIYSIDLILTKICTFFLLSIYLHFILAMFFLLYNKKKGKFFNPIKILKCYLMFFYFIFLTLFINFYNNNKSSNFIA